MPLEVRSAREIAIQKLSALSLEEELTMLHVACEKSHDVIFAIQCLQ